MADYYSDQMTNLNASPVTLGKPYEGGAPVRRNWFTYTVPTGGVAATKTLSLTKLPAGAIVLGGKVATDGLVALADIDIGTSASANRYGDALDVSSAGAVSFASNIAENIGDILTAETEIQATNPAGAATWTAAKLIKGYIEWALI